MVNNYDEALAYITGTSWKEKKGVPWLQIPFYSQEGKLIGVQNRNLVKGGLPRFRFPQGSECGIYNLPVLKMLRPGEDLYITEGSSDCWSMLSAGHKAVAIPSATLFNAKEFKKELMSAHVLENENTLHIYPDKDAAGEYLYQQIHSAAKELGFQLIRHELPEGCKAVYDNNFSIAAVIEKSSDAAEGEGEAAEGGEAAAPAAPAAK